MSAKVDRRKFIHYSASLAMGFALRDLSYLHQTPGRSKGTLASQFMLTNKSSVKAGVLLLDLDRNIFREISTPFAIHKVTGSGSLAYGVSGYYGFIAAIDLRNGRLPKTEAPPANINFLGHLEVSNDGRLLYASATQNN